MQIRYRNGKVKDLFEDFRAMQVKIGMEITRAVKKNYDHLIAASSFGAYLSIGLGKPHPLDGDKKRCYGVMVTANIRLIVEPLTDDLSPAGLKSCKEVELKGVCDYHGGKDNWIIP